MKTQYRNLIGPQVRKIRYQRGMTQEQLAIKLQMAGYDRSRGTLAKIEARLLWVGDHELFFFAKVLGVPMSALFPPIDSQDPDLHETIDRLMTRRF
jgi:transcriptional regulator with XRE-family HTH domain